MPIIKKAIQLKVLLRVEGEQEARDDFAALTTNAVRDAICAAKLRAPVPLKVAACKIAEYSSDDENGDA